MRSNSHHPSLASFVSFLIDLFIWQDGEAKITSIVCSPNGTRTAIACADRSVALLDENGNQKDRFTCKPVDSKVSHGSVKLLVVLYSVWKEIVQRLVHDIFF